MIASVVFVLEEDDIAWLRSSIFHSPEKFQETDEINIQIHSDVARNGDM